MCYPASFLQKAYNFPATSGWKGLDGTGSTIVIVDAFGSPTIQSDLDTYDSTFGLPSATVTILCGPSWTGSSTDICPVNTIADLSTAPNAALCGATGWAEETTLDVTMAHSLAPGAHIVLVVANDCYDSSLYGAEQAVIAQHKFDGSIMTQSFGEPDDLVTCLTVDPVSLQCTSNDPTLLNLPNSVFQSATMHRWTILASTGDDGADEDVRFDGNGQLMPSFPATNPLVLGVGGTQGNPYGGQFGSFPGKGGVFACAAGAICNTGLVVINGGANGCGTALRPAVPSSCYPVGYGGEGVWNEYTSFGGYLGSGIGRSSGGGVSTLYSKPFYQFFTPRTVTTFLGAQMSTTTGRNSPDVSFNAAAQGGVLAYLGFVGAWAVFSGTSAASPAWAAIIALLNQANHRPVGFINPQIYLLGTAFSFLHGHSNTAPFHDITSGENSDLAGDFGVDGYNAQTGYDLATGWGTPNVSNFIHDILPLV
jgi:subtilase family serine protease